MRSHLRHHIYLRHVPTGKLRVEARGSEKHRAAGWREREREKQGEHPRDALRKVERETNENVEPHTRDAAEFSEQRGSRYFLQKAHLLHSPYLGRVPRTQV